MKYYPKVEKFVEESFGRISDGTEFAGENNVTHLKRTVYWIKQLKPDADEALLIAAVSHDIERAYRNFERMKDLKWATPEYYAEHQGSGAKVIGDFLRKEGADEKLINKVKELISHHEFGGDDDKNLLKDADTISFFENQIQIFLTIQVKKFGKEAVMNKFKKMYARLTSSKAREIVTPWYEEAIKKLESHAGK